MASVVHERISRSSAEFVQSSILETIVPSNENVNIETAFQAWDRQIDQNDESLLPFIEQRHFLLLGTSLAVHDVNQHLTHSQACR
jgi:hypothetical protein